MTSLLSTAGLATTADLDAKLAEVSEESKYPSPNCRAIKTALAAVMAADGTRACLVVTGDSTALSLYPTGVESQLYESYGFRAIWMQLSDGYNLVSTSTPGGVESGTTTVADGWTKSLNGQHWRMASSGNRIAFVLSPDFFAGAKRQPVDKATIVYFRQAGGGVFKVQSLRANGTASNDAYWQDIDGADSISTDGTGMASIAVDLPAREAGAQVRVLYVSGGNVDIIGCLLEDTQSRGFCFAPIAKGGTAQANLNTIADADIAVILGVIKPDLVTISQKDNNSPATAATLAAATIAKWKTAYTATDILFLNHYPDNELSTATDVAAHSAAVKAAVELAGCEFYDTGRLVPDYATAVALGLMGDNVHMNARGQNLLGSAMWRAIGIHRFDTTGRLQTTISAASVDTPLLRISGVDQEILRRQLVTQSRLQLPFVRLPASTQSAVRNVVARSAIGAASFTILLRVQVPATPATAQLIILRSGTGGGNQTSAASFSVGSSFARFSQRNASNTGTITWNGGSAQATEFWSRAGEIITIAVRRNADAAVGETPITTFIGETKWPNYTVADATGLEDFTGQFVGAGSFVTDIGTNDLDIFGFAVYPSALSDDAITQFSRAGEFPGGSNTFFPCDDGAGLPRNGGALIGSARWQNVRSNTNRIVGTATLISGTVTVANATITASSVIQVTRSSVNSSSALGTFVVTRAAGTSFTITSRKDDATTETNDNSIVQFLVVEP